MYSKPPAEMRSPRPARCQINAAGHHQPFAKALENLKDMGLPYDNLLDDTQAAELWLTRGASFGEVGFRKFFPRKSPVMHFWEQNGMIIPSKACHATVLH